jgi:predicted HTH transcriptional regulator
MIRGEEGLVVEYKRSVESVEQEDFVALANAKGGVVLVGIEEPKIEVVYVEINATPSPSC